MAHDGVDGNNQRFKSQARLAALGEDKDEEGPRISLDSPVLLGILVALFIFTGFRALRPTVPVEPPPSRLTLSELREIEDRGLYLEGKCTNATDRVASKAVFQVFYGSSNPPTYVVVENIRPGEVRAFRAGPYHSGVYAAAGKAKREDRRVVPFSVEWKT